MQKKLTIEDTATRVKELREAMGLTQAQFAVQVGVTVTQVNRWENAKAVPHLICQTALIKLEGDYFEDE